jgi:hypothetical protein
MLLVSGTATIAQAKKKSVVVTAKQLAPLMLTAKDLGKGWKVNTSAPPNEPSATGGPCGGPNAAARAATNDEAATAEANLVKDPQAGPVIFEVVYAFPATQQAKTFMQTNRDVLGSCPASDRVNPANGRAYHDTATGLSFPAMGDDVVAFEQTDAPVDGSSAAVPFHNAYVRRGALVLSVAVGGAGVATTARYARTALAKLASN